MPEKKVWGNACWFLFHVAAMRIRSERQDQIQRLLDKIIYVCRHLPCPICTEHAVNTFNSIRRENIKTKEDLILCIFQLHNIVNARTKKPQFSIEDHNKMYENAPLDVVFNNWRIIMSRNLPGERNMLYTMSRNNMVKDVTSFFVNNRSSFH